MFQTTVAYHHPCFVNSFYRHSRSDEELAHLRLVTAHLGLDKKKYEIGEMMFQTVVLTVFHVSYFLFSRPFQGLASITLIFVG